MTELNATQLLRVLQSGPMLDRVAGGTSVALQKQLLDFQKRAGDAYAAGNWQVEANGEQFSVAPRSAAPSREEAQAVLGQAYLELREQKKALRHLMDEMGLNPTAQQKNWLERAVNNVAGFFR